MNKIEYIFQCPCGKSTKMKLWNGKTPRVCPHCGKHPVLVKLDDIRPNVVEIVKGEARVLAEKLLERNRAFDPDEAINRLKQENEELKAKIEEREESIRNNDSTAFLKVINFNS